MIKRILFLSLLVCLTMPAFSQSNGLHSLLQPVSPNLLTGLTNKIMRLLTPHPDNWWITAIKKTSANAQIPHGYLGIQNVFTPEPKPVKENLSTAQKRFFLYRFNQIKNTLNNQKYYRFYNYQLIIPRESDLLKLSNEDVDRLQRFFRQPLPANEIDSEFRKLSVESYKNHIVKVTLPHEMYVFFDCFRKKIYLVYQTLDIVNLPSKNTEPEKVYNPS